jgi:peptide/nickel transport system permease protein
MEVNLKNLRPRGVRRQSNYRNLVWRQFSRHRLAMVGALIILVLSGLSLAAPYLSPYSFRAYNPDQVLQRPDPAHWLGTDELGRDVLTRLLWGGRVSLTVGVAAMLVAMLIGVTLGVAAGYYGGVVDNLLMRGTDLMLSFPALFLYIILAAFCNTRLIHLVLIIGGMSWMEVARLVRSSFLSLRQLEFTQAAKAMGIPDVQIIFRHLLPNALSPLTVAITLGIASAVLSESALSYLGLGVQPPWPSWGNMLSNSQHYIWQSPWLAIYPGVCIFLTVLSFHFLGDGLRDALDPRLKEESSREADYRKLD